MFLGLLNGGQRTETNLSPWRRDRMHLHLTGTPCPSTVLTCPCCTNIRFIPFSAISSFTDTRTNEYRFSRCFIQVRKKRHGWWSRLNNCQPKISSPSPWTWKWHLNSYYGFQNEGDVRMEIDGLIWSNERNLMLQSIWLIEYILRPPPGPGKGLRKGGM